MKPCLSCNQALFTMQLSLVYHATKPCLPYNQVLFIIQPSLVYHATKPCFQRSHISPYSAYNRFHHSATRNRRPTRDQLPSRLQRYNIPPPVCKFSAHFFRPTMPPMYFGCTSITKYTRRKAPQLPHTQPKTASRLPKGVLVYFL